MSDTSGRCNSATQHPLSVELSTPLLVYENSTSIARRVGPFSDRYRYKRRSLIDGLSFAFILDVDTSLIIGDIDGVFHKLSLYLTVALATLPVIASPAILQVRNCPQCPKGTHEVIPSRPGYCDNKPVPCCGVCGAYRLLLHLRLVVRVTDECSTFYD